MWSNNDKIKGAYYIQDYKNPTFKFDATKPFFIMGISSATHYNTDALKNTLYDLIKL